MNVDGLIVQTRFLFSSSGEGEGAVGSMLTTLPIFTNTRADAAALVVVEYHYIDGEGNRLDIPYQRTMNGQSGLLIPAGMTAEHDGTWYGFYDVIEAQGDKSAAVGVETVVKSVTWLDAVEAGYVRLFRAGSFEETCRNDAKIGCSFTNANPYPVTAVPVGLVCYITPNRDQCHGQGYFWNGQPTTIDPNSSTMLMLTKRQANDLTHLYDSLPAEQNGSTLDWFVRYWLPADQPNWPQ